MALVVLSIVLGVLALALLVWHERRQDVSDELRDALGLSERQIAI